MKNIYMYVQKSNVRIFPSRLKKRKRKEILLISNKIDIHIFIVYSNFLYQKKGTVQKRKKRKQKNSANS